MWFKNPNKLLAGGNSDVVVHETKKDPDEPGSPLAKSPSLLDEFLAEETREKRIAAELEERPVFTTGEVLLIRGGFFKVAHLTEKRMYLDFQGEAGEILKANER